MLSMLTSDGARLMVATARRAQYNAPPPPARAWQAAFADLPREHGFEPLHVEGVVPGDLVGTLYRNGPAMYQAQGMAYQHLFDGDGGVMAVRLDGAKAKGAVRLVQSDGLIAERRAGKPLYPGFGTPAPSRLRWVMNRDIKNVANTNVIAWQGRLFALMEAALPVELHPETLDTMGERDFHGTIRTSFSAHPHRVDRRKASYNFGMRFGRFPVLDLYELPDQGPIRHLKRIRLSWNAMIHDFIATERHLVFFVPPVRLKILPTLLGSGSLAENLTWERSLGTEIIVVPIDDPDAVIRYRVPAFYQWHFANAFDGADGSIVADVIRYPDWENSLLLDSLQQRPFEKIATGRLTRVVLEPHLRRMEVARMDDVPAEFPRIDPRREGQAATYSYMATSSCAVNAAWDEVSKVELATGKREVIAFDGQHDYVSEPVFAPRIGAAPDTEDDGYILTQVYFGGRGCSGIAIHDARRIADGPVGTVLFDHHLPPSFHGNWVPAAV